MKIDKFFFRGVLFAALAAAAGFANAQVFATVRGTVIDPQERAIPNAKVILKSQTSAWTSEAETDQQGGFVMGAVPAGSYTIEIRHADFTTMTQLLNVTIGAAPTLMFMMELGSVSTTAEVTAQLEVTNPDESSPPVMVNVQDIMHTPGASRANSLAFVTQFVPGTYMLHDHIHMRGGHQVSWLVDGVPVPNTNLSSNVSRILDPKDMETVEIARGGYSARYGDRTYGVINVIPRSGFEFDNKDVDLTLSYGSYYQTNDQLTFGGHSNTFAYYASLTGSRTNLGLEPPEEQIIHNRGSGLGIFTSLMYNLTERDMFRLAASTRRDHYQIPNTAQDQALGIRDVDQERDSFMNFSWVHTYGPGTLLTVSPFYHNNRGQYLGGNNDPLQTTADHTSRYSGGQITLGLVRGEHNMHIGAYGYYQNDDALFQIRQQSPLITATERQPFTGGIFSPFVDDQYKPWKWLTLNAGVRFTHSVAGVTESATSPRLGAVIDIPKLKWVLRAFYGRYYQPPPLATIGGPVLDFAAQEGFSFLPLHGERDQQREFGLTVPFKGWVLDFSNFRTNASNFGDHDVLGNSNLSLPLTVQSVRIRGLEATARSPQVWKRARFYLAISDQTVQGRGAITGGLTDFHPPATDYFYIDHDQRVTMTTGGEFVLPRQAWFSANLEYGSGFLDGDGPAHLPQHITGSFSFGKSFGERWSFTVTTLNVSNTRYLLGRNSSFAGTHYNDPRQIIGSVRYHFHF